MNYMYAQYVKNTMQTLNIADVSTDRRFPWTVCTSALASRQLPLCLLPSFSAGFLSRVAATGGESRSRQRADQEFALHPHQEWKEGQSDW